MKKLSTVKDGKEEFKLSKRSKIVYVVTRKIKGGVEITSVTSHRTYTKKGKTLVYPT